MGLTAHSTWKFNVPHSFGVHHALAPDRYRGTFGYDDPEAGRKYADDVKSVIDYTTSGRVAGFIAESIQGVGGTVVFPDGYLEKAYAHVRAAGGVCIADEVQAGFGRTGTHFWGFETQGVVPDIVTMAKSIGNGVPLAAVVTTHKIAETIKSRVHFNTFGGNPVVCAQGKAVLEVIEREGLQANSLKIGNYLMDGLRALAREARPHRRRARQGSDDRRRTGQGPRHQNARQGRSDPRLRDDQRRRACSSARAGISATCCASSRRCA